MSVRTACKCNETDKQLQNVCVVDYKSNNDYNSTGILPSCCTGGLLISEEQKCNVFRIRSSSLHVSLVVLL